MNLYHFIAAGNTRDSAALDKLVLVILRCRTDPFSRSFLPATLRLWNCCRRVFLVVAP